MSRRTRELRWHGNEPARPPADDQETPVKVSEAQARPQSPPPGKAQGHLAASASPATPSVGEADKAGPWERWTHHLATSDIPKVGDVEIVGMWPPDATRGLPARLHAEALAMGLEYLGPAAPGGAPAPVVSAKPKVELPRAPADGWEVWTHHLQGPPPDKVGDVEVGYMTVRGKRIEWQWTPGERRGLPARVHDAAMALGLEYLGPAPVAGAAGAPAADGQASLMRARIADLEAENARLRAKQAAVEP